MNKDQSVYAILHEILTEQQNLLRKVSAKMYTQSISFSGRFYHWPVTRDILLSFWKFYGTLIIRIRLIMTKDREIRNWNRILKRR